MEEEERQVKKTEPCAVARAQKGSKKEHMMEERQMKCKESWTVVHFSQALSYIEKEKIKIEVFSTITSATRIEASV